MTKDELLKKINYGKLRGAQAKLSKELSLSEAAITNWFSGKNYPTEENIQKIAKTYKLDIDEVRRAFYTYNNEQTQKSNKIEGLREIDIVPLTPKNTIQLPILADVPAGLPDYSDRDVEMFVDIPRFMFPKADYVVRCIGDSLEPKIHRGDFCVIRTMQEPLDGKAMLVRTESGICMKVIKKMADGLVKLCSTNPAYKPFTPKSLEVLGQIIGHWSRDDRESF